MNSGTWRIVIERRRELIALLLLFAVALSLRLHYQQESAVNNPLRADAGKYFSAAQNLWRFGVYSEARPRTSDRPPESRTDLAPGYPLFLALLMDKESLGRPGEFIDRVTRLQAVLGSLVAVFAFLLARSFASLPWACVAGSLTALNPHLIAMDGLILTESLFTFVLMLGMLVLTFAWRDDRLLLTLVASIALAATMQIRSVSYLLVPFVALVFLWVQGRPRWALDARWPRHLLVLAVGLFVVIGAHREFVKATVTHESGWAAALVGRSDAHAERRPPERYVVFMGPLHYVNNAIRPPDFFVDGKSHILAQHGDRDSRAATEASFREEPAAYLAWLAYGKLATSWHWDNSYNGDVYTYPMLRKGFSESAPLGIAYAILRTLHWPLFFLALGAPLALFLRWRGGELGRTEWAAIIPVLGFAYLLAVLWVLSWLPRYTIPARPLSYVLVVVSLSSLATAWATRQPRKPAPASGGAARRRGRRPKR